MSPRWPRIARVAEARCNATDQAHAAQHVPHCAPAATRGSIHQQSSTGHRDEPRSHVFFKADAVPPRSLPYALRRAVSKQVRPIAWVHVSSPAGQPADSPTGFCASTARLRRSILSFTATRVPHESGNLPALSTCRALLNHDVISTSLAQLHTTREHEDFSETSNLLDVPPPDQSAAGDGRIAPRARIPGLIYQTGVTSRADQVGAGGS
jgi:hypothetical protein